MLTSGSIRISQTHVPFSLLGLNVFSNRSEFEATKMLLFSVASFELFAGTYESSTCDCLSEFHYPRELVLISVRENAYAREGNGMIELAIGNNQCDSPHRRTFR